MEGEECIEVNNQIKEISNAQLTILQQERDSTGHP